MKAYPLMISRHNKLPPFIHPHLTAAGIGSDDTEPMNNCTSLLHMISAQVQGSRKLFWRNVRTECERFCVEVFLNHTYANFENFLEKLIESF
jgi:hypothetical protein